MIAAAVLGQIGIEAVLGAAVGWIIRLARSWFASRGTSSVSRLPFAIGQQRLAQGSSAWQPSRQWSNQRRARALNLAWSLSARGRL
jgi:hypothetical protein